MKRLIILISLSFLSIAAGIQIENHDGLEYSLQDFKLKILCPKCGITLYGCNVDEFFYLEPLVAGMCQPTLSGLVPFAPGYKLICPVDKTEPFRNNECLIKDVRECSSIFTNKGWLPKRSRPA